MSSKKAAKGAKRGPKSAEGRLAVRLNASTHGILSPQPIVNAYERPEDWEGHRAAIVDSLSPESGPRSCRRPCQAYLRTFFSTTQSSR